MSGFRVALDLGNSLVSQAGPEDLAGLLVQAEDPPLVDGIVLHRLDISIEADPQNRLGLAADGGGHEQAVTPDHGAGVAESRDHGLPAQIHRVVDVPAHRRVAAGEAAGLRSAEGWPVVTGVVRGGEGR
jgi:hypothetical protein